MDTRISTNWSNQRLYQWVQSWALSYDKLMQKRGFWTILIAVLIFGLILAFIFAEMPISGENLPVPGYP